MSTARKHEELECWQLAYELKVRIFKVLDRPMVRQDVDFCRQIRKSSRSIPALIAEGFARRNKEFKRYLEMALGELGETRNHLRDGADCGHFDVQEFRDLWHLCYRIRGASLGLIRYLKGCIEAEEEKKRSARQARKPPQASDEKPDA
jgi:four helix bundle protein